MLPAFVLKWCAGFRRVVQSQATSDRVAPLRMTLAPRARQSMAPPGVDPALFDLKWRVYALRMPPKLTQNAVIALKGHVMRVPRLAVVARPAADEKERFILLKYFSEDPKKLPESFKGNMDLCGVGNPEKVANLIAGTTFGPKVGPDVMTLLSEVNAGRIDEKEVDIGYKQWPMDAILKEILPEGTVIPSSFESVGHIAHMNLRDEHKSFKTLIASVVLDKLFPRIRTVVNKTESTGGPYRTFAMEVIAGEHNLETSLRENGCAFQLDFSKVYWNSRLETEHRRVIDSLCSDDILADAFCGIGPFALPAYKLRKCKVYANDLNPSSVEYLRRNATKNGIQEGVEHGFVASCGCAREFLTRTVREQHVPITQFVMNFPSGAPEFLDTFIGLYNGLESLKLPMPTVHCYCFARGDDWKENATQRVREALGMDSSDELHVQVREVRDVAPKKRQVCVRFTLPATVAYRDSVAAELDSGVSSDPQAPSSKRRRTESCGVI